MVILGGMIIYDLTCRLGHTFEGWFPNFKAFEKQQTLGLVQCQTCGDPGVKRALSGGHYIGKSTRSPVKESAPAKSLQPETAVTGQIDPVTLVKAVRHYVKSNFEDVGKQFATKAIAMKNGEEPHKNIYGQVTREEKEKLNEEEIPHFTIPDLPPEFEN